jgi:hypothetical protein
MLAVQPDPTSTEFFKSIKYFTQKQKKLVNPDLIMKKKKEKKICDYVKHAF